jgi:mannose-1-phosphate guanylyltransferase
VKQANDNKLVTFGIVPTDANTGYGYIKSLKNGQVEAFVEKPDLQTAQSYLVAP